MHFVLGPTRECLEKFLRMGHLEIDLELPLGHDRTIVAPHTEGLGPADEEGLPVREALQAGTVTVVAEIC